MISTTDNSYKCAAKDIQQEKKMVKALKRLSIGNLMMNYDPDLPIEEKDFQLPQMNKIYNENIMNDSTDNLNISNSLNVTTFKSNFRNNSNYNDDNDDNDVSITNEKNQKSFASEDNDQILDVSSSSLWVPAYLHPEVDPDQFKKLIKSTVEELVERKTSRNNTLSRRSSLSRSISRSTSIEENKDKENNCERENDDEGENDEGENDEGENKDQNEVYIEKEKDRHLFQEQKSYSNPSLRDLSYELEELSKLAGMDANDAVTLARTLSGASLGYTDVERLAFDELNSPPRSSASISSIKNDLSRNDEIFDIESFTSESGLTSSLDNSLQLQRSRLGDVSLRRSRRYDYRKHSMSSSSSSSSSSITGSRSNKNEKSNDLKNNLNSNDSETINQQLQLRTKQKNKDNVHFSPNSQIILNQKTRNEVNTASSLSLGENPPNSDSDLSIPPKEYSVNSEHGLAFKRLSHIKSIQESHYDSAQGLNQNQKNSKSYSSIYKKDNNRPRQLPPVHPCPSSSKNNKENYYNKNNSSIINQKDVSINSDLNQSQINLPGQLNNHEYSDNDNSSYKGQKKLYQPYLITPTSPSNNKSQQLNQNLDLLRSEINEFKEKLLKNESISSNVDKSFDNKSDSFDSAYNDLEFGAHAKYQDISYEDSLGIDKEVMEEIKEEKKDKILSFNKSENIDSDLSINNSQRENYTKVSLVPDKTAISYNKMDTIYLKEMIETGLSNSKPENINESVSLDDTYDIFDHKWKFEGGPALRYGKEKSSVTQEKGKLSQQDHLSRSLSQRVGLEKERRTSQCLRSNKENAENSYPLDNIPLNEEDKSQFISDNDDLEFTNMINDLEYYLEKNIEIEKKEKESTKPQPFPLVEKLNQTKFIDEPLMSKKTYDNVISSMMDDDDSDILSVRSVPLQEGKNKSIGVLPNHSMNSLNTEDMSNYTSQKRIKKKKSWSWLMELTIGKLSADSNKLPTVSESESEPEPMNMPTRSLTDPGESSNVNENMIKQKQKITDKDNVITKFFKKKKSFVSLNSILNNNKDLDLNTSCEPDNETKLNFKKQSSGIFKKKSKKKISDSQVNNPIKESKKSKSSNSVNSIYESSSLEDQESDDEEMNSKQVNVSYNNYNYNNYNNFEQLDNQLDSIKDDPIVFEKLNEKEEKKLKFISKPFKNKKKSNGQNSQKSKSQNNVSQEVELDEEEERSLKSNVDIQEKLKKTIRRNPKANAPIEFIESSIGFPLPPPSPSTLIMLNYRYPANVERAIYRLSHVKLANTKRSLREQVLLSNFMYAYLNLIDHTLQLEQFNNENQCQGQFYLTDPTDDELYITDSDDNYDSEMNLENNDNIITNSDDKSNLFDLDTNDMDNIKLQA